MKRRIAVICAGVAALTLVSPQIASADGRAAVSGGYVRFWSEGDVFRVYDVACDGFGPEFQWQTPYNHGAGGATNNGGCGTNLKYDEVNFAENVQIKYRIRLVNGSSWSAWTSDHT